MSSCTSSVFVDQADPEYQLYCGVTDEFSSFTVELWDHETVLSDAKLASRTFHAPHCSGSFWMPMQTANVEVTCGKSCVKVVHMYYGELGLTVTTADHDHSAACTLLTNDAPYEAYDVAAGVRRRLLWALIGMAIGVVIGLVMIGVNGVNWRRLIRRMIGRERRPQAPGTLV